MIYAVAKGMIQIPIGLAWGCAKLLTKGAACTVSASGKLAWVGAKLIAQGCAYTISTSGKLAWGSAKLLIKGVKVTGETILFAGGEKITEIRTQQTITWGLINNNTIQVTSSLKQETIKSVPYIQRPIRFIIPKIYTWTKDAASCAKRVVAQQLAPYRRRINQAVVRSANYMAGRINQAIVARREQFMGYIDLHPNFEFDNFFRN